MQGRLKEYKKMNLVVFELKSEAMKERHWKILLKKIHMQNTLWREITLG